MPSVIDTQGSGEEGTGDCKGCEGCCPCADDKDDSKEKGHQSSKESGQQSSSEKGNKSGERGSDEDDRLRFGGGAVLPYNRLSGYRDRPFHFYNQERYGSANAVDQRAPVVIVLGEGGHSDLSWLRRLLNEG
ncbi:hypothetical protein Pmani_014752 [Petrolisthes manimaculis]|uniref:Uncharacterized protein n=1 Tax=Petrolisthes manimaculis TaxID=1843537 RepID=A0AAE1UCB3_9EUCA|nr:hypothetical protein Pmani_014752 [Petrolisthes manimaculis]